MSNNLIQVLKKHSRKISFHTPGHNNTLPKEFLKYDVTELCYSDNLLDAKGVIKELEQNIAKLYKAKRAFISTNGATNCILTALYSVMDKGGFLIVGQTHKSVYNAIRLTKNKAYYIDEINENNIDNLPCDIKTLIVTYPDYLGNCIDIEYYQRIAKQKNYILIIDSSHGSHFIFHDKFPVSASEYGDLVIISAHKTLPVPTGGAILLCNNESLALNIQLARKIFHSTSPSYITLAGIDRAFSIYSKNSQQMYDEVYNEIIVFKDNLPDNFSCEMNNDFSRLVIKSRFQGKAVLDKLFQMGIALEMSYENKVVAIVTPYNYRYLKKLNNALNKIIKEDLPVFNQASPIRKSYEVKQAFFGGDFEFVHIDKALNRRAYTEIGIYPPGTPLIKSGEIITKDAIKTIKENANNCFGLENNAVAVILLDNGGKR